MTAASAKAQPAAFERAPSVLWLRLHEALGHGAVDVTACRQEPCPAAFRAVVAFLRAQYNGQRVGVLLGREAR